MVSNLGNFQIFTCNQKRFYKHIFRFSLPLNLRLMTCELEEVPGGTLNIWGAIILGNTCILGFPANLGKQKFHL